MTPSRSLVFVGQTIPPTKPAPSGPITKQRREKALPALLAVLGLAGIGLALSRTLLFARPAPPPAGADATALRRYWKARLKTNVVDRDAYLQLGLLEERTGYSLAARRNLEAARALGASDRDICGPLGRALNQLAQQEAAEAEFAKAVRIGPDSLEAALNLAGFYVTTQQSARARTLLEEFWSRRGASLSVKEKERLALAFLECGEVSKARQAAESVLAAEPADKTAAMLAARCAFTMDDTAAARKFVETALQGDEGSADAQYFYGLVLRKAGDNDGALKAWQRASAANPRLTDVYERIGEEYARRKDYRRAALVLERVALTTRSPSSIIRTAEAYRNSHLPDDAAYWDAVAAGMQGNYPLALEKGNIAAASANPAVRRRGLSAIAEAYHGMGKKKEFLAATLEATRAETADDLMIRATAYESVNAYADYIATLRQVMKKDPSREAAISFDLSKTLSLTGNQAEAQKAVLRAVELEPQNATFLIGLAGFYLKKSSEGDNLTQATQLALKATQLAPGEELTWRTLGQCYALTGQLPLAAQCFEHCIDLEPGRGNTYLELSRVYARMGNPDGAKEMMRLNQKFVAFEQERQAVELRARQKGASAADLMAYGDLELNLGDSAESVKAYERALTLSPKDPTIKTTLTQLYQRLNLPDRLARLQQGGAK